MHRLEHRRSFNGLIRPIQATKTQYLEKTSKFSLQIKYKPKKTFRLGRQNVKKEVKTKSNCRHMDDVLNRKT
jgi:hypothetical protein